MAAGTYRDFLDALGQRESSGNYAAENVFHYIGKYQMGEAALIDIGVVNHDGSAFNNDYSGGFTGKFGLTSKADFLSDGPGQELAIRAYMDVQFGYLKSVGALPYAGQVLDGTLITVSSLLGMAHLVGFTRAAEFVKSGGDIDPADSFSTSASEYAALFSNYGTPFTVDHSLAEVIAGGSGGDVLRGRGGDDTLLGKGGSDRLLGGAGEDTFRFNTVSHIRGDRIGDFASGSDVIDLRRIDADRTADGNQAFGFIGDADFSAAGQLRFETNILLGDTNGDGTADFRLRLPGVDALQADDFLL
jgi:Ca2+-binding RTX toxin-like protein